MAVVAFHIGRGGRFHNSGHKTFYGEYNIMEVINRQDHKISWHNKNSLGRFCEPFYADSSGNVLITEKQAATGVGTLDFDGEYDTYICKRLEDCTEAELDILERSAISYHLRQQINRV
jgi:hypothetical protein